MNRTYVILIFIFMTVAIAESSTDVDCLNTECHGNLTDGKYVHYTIDVHYLKENDVKYGCLVCHEGSYSSHPEEDHFSLAHNGQKMLCRQCHEGMPVDYESKHGVIDTIGCLPCHEPHKSEHRQFLKNNGIDMCSVCHEETKRTHKGIKYKGKSGTSSDCLFCHTPHVSHYKALLKTNEN